MWHSHLHDVEILETKRFSPKGLELGTTERPFTDAAAIRSGHHNSRRVCCHQFPDLFFFLKKEQGEFKPL